MKKKSALVVQLKNTFLIDLGTYFNTLCILYTLYYYFMLEYEIPDRNLNQNKS